MTRALAGAGALLIAAALSGCNKLDDYTAADLGNPVKRHAIGFGAQSEALYVELAPSGGGLSNNQHADVFRFVDRYKKESNGSLRISAPGSAGGHLASAGTVRQVEEIVRDAGVDPAAVEIVRHKGSSRMGPAIKLAYDRPVAAPPNCGDWNTDLGENRERLPYNDFGCSTQRNLALNVANARDLQAPQDETPRSSERRSMSWRDYTGSGKNGQAPTAGPATPTIDDAGGSPAVQ
jgi:pilus assembly protein CpaD